MNQNEVKPENALSDDMLEEVSGGYEEAHEEFKPNIFRGRADDGRFRG